MRELQSCFRRYEKKYLLTPEQYAAMKRGMASWMKPDEHPNYTICNIYFDTENYDLIRTSLEKPVYLVAKQPTVFIMLIDGLPSLHRDSPE